MNVLSDDQRTFLTILAARIVPESAQLAPADRERFFAYIQSALAARPAAMRSQFGLFLQALKWLPALRYKTSLDKLPAETQDAVLAWFQDAPIGLLRSGFWGLKTLVFMGYYGRPEIGEKLGYKPSRTGNALLKKAP